VQRVTYPKNIAPTTSATSPTALPSEFAAPLVGFVEMDAVVLAMTLVAVVPPVDVDVDEEIAAVLRFEDTMVGSIVTF